LELFRAGFYLCGSRHAEAKSVLDEIKAEPSSVTFDDDNIENVLSARSLGNGILFDDAKRVRQALRYAVGDPMRRGWAFLQVLILEATSNR
jgi:hypothetical protein